MGVDSVPHEDAADEPLFAMLPLPYELLFVCGIARQPEAAQSLDTHLVKDSVIEMGNVPQESDRNAKIDEAKKKLPARLSDNIQTIDETQPVEQDLPQPSKSKVEMPDDDEIQPSDSANPMQFTSSRRGWPNDGNFRSYRELQRSGAPRTKSDYAQRPGMSNKRSRSKFFRSR